VGSVSAAGDSRRDGWKTRWLSPAAESFPFRVCLRVLVFSPSPAFAVPESRRARYRKNAVAFIRLPRHAGWAVSQSGETVYAGGSIMPRGDKSKYTEKQQRQAEHIEEGYQKRGTPKGEAERRAWSTVNKMTHGGKKAGGSGRGKAEDHSPARRGGHKGAAAQSHATRVQAGKKAARPRKARAGRS